MKILNFVEDLAYRTFQSLQRKTPIYVNAYVSRDLSEKYNRNWGDDINYWFLKEIIKRPLRLYNESPIAFRKNDDNYLVIGSTISLLAKTSSIVWGAGCITDKKELPNTPKKVLAVRGPLTKQYLQERGIECPEVYGDPALLLPMHYLPQRKKRYPIGLIQHVSEKPLEIKGCHRISMNDYEKWTDVIDEICACEVVASSSLHGLIVAEAYGIPNVWIETKKLLGGILNFTIFFLSFGADRSNPVGLSDKITAESLIDHAVDSKVHNLDLSPLIDSCPFEIELKYR